MKGKGENDESRLYSSIELKRGDRKRWYWQMPLMVINIIIMFAFPKSHHRHQNNCRYCGYCRCRQGVNLDVFGCRSLPELPHLSTPASFALSTFSWNRRKAVVCCSKLNETDRFEADFPPTSFINNNCRRCFHLNFFRYRLVRISNCLCFSLLVLHRLSFSIQFAYTSVGNLSLCNFTIIFIYPYLFYSLLIEIYGFALVFFSFSSPSSISYLN